MRAFGAAGGTLGHGLGSSGQAKRGYQGAPGWATDAILGAFYEVYNELGAGFLESVYEAAMAIALGAMQIDVERQAQVGSTICGRPNLEVGLLLNFGARPDFKRLAYSNDRKRARHSVEPQKQKN